MRFLSSEFELHVNSLDDEHIVLQLDFTQCIRGQPLIRRIDLARFQRASEGSRKSTGGRCDNVVQSCGMGLQHVWWNFVVFSHRAVDAKDYGV